MMAPAELFVAVGRFLFGEHYTAPIAKLLNVSVDLVDEWGKDRGSPPPPIIWRVMLEALDERASRVAALMKEALEHSDPMVIECTRVELLAQGLDMVRYPAKFQDLQKAFNDLSRRSAMPGGSIVEREGRYIMTFPRRLSLPESENLKIWLTVKIRHLNDPNAVADLSFWQPASGATTSA